MAPEIPPRAKAILANLAVANDLTLDELLVVTREQTVTAVRHQAWAILRAEEGDTGRKLYSDGRIGAWFGVKPRAVGAAVKRLDRKAKSAG